MILIHSCSFIFILKRSAQF